jgi:hypothetical protein
LSAYAGGVSIGNRDFKEIHMLSSGYNGPNVRRARAMRARVLGRLVRRSYAALAALHRRQQDALRKAAALDELAHRSHRMLGDIGLQPGDLLQMRHGPR